MGQLAENGQEGSVETTLPLGKVANMMQGIFLKNEYLVGLQDDLAHCAYILAMYCLFCSDGLYISHI